MYAGNAFDSFMLITFLNSENINSLVPTQFSYRKHNFGLL